MYPEKLLIPLYRNLLRLSSGRGAHTLAKVDASLFNFQREIAINSDGSVSILLPPNPHFLGYLLKVHELHVSQAITRLVNEGDVVVDVGANIGYFSGWAAAAVGQQGQVFCLEPEIQNFEHLKTNCDWLKNRGFNCFAYQLGASSNNGQAELRIHRHSTYHSIEDEYHNLDKIERTETINLVRLDEWVKSQDIHKISLLKIDTEGHEPKVLEGASRLYEARAVNYTLLECRSEYISSYVDNFCKEFNLYQLVWDGHQWHDSTQQISNSKAECLLSVQPVSPESLC
jgi:FkbM family methyltransferase